jgi:hypothetical protein
MSLEQAITDHASALRELAAAIRATISGAHNISAAIKTVAEASPEQLVAAVDSKAATDKVINDAKKPVDTQTAATTAKAGTAAESPSDAPAPDYEAVKAKALQLSKDKGRDPLIALLQRHGVAKAPDLKAEQYAAFIADVDAIIAGTYDPSAAELVD